MRSLRLSPARLFPLLFCGLLALISCRIYLHSGIPTTHDGENHLARFANYKTALREGQIPPRFAPNLYHRYGYPVFNYNYPLPSILSVPFSVIKTPYPTTFKVIMLAAVTLLLFGMWRWLTELKFNLWAKTLAVTSIAASPYLLSTIIYRGSIGEVLALCGITWWLVWVEKIRQSCAELGGKAPWQSYIFSSQTLVGGVLLALFFLSHNVTVLFGTPVMLLFSFWWLWKTKQCYLKVLGALGIGLGLTLWFWIPALAEQSAVVVGGSSLAQQYLQHFPTFHQLLSSPFQFGFSFVGSVDSLSFGVGWVQWLALFCTVGWLLAAAFRQKVARQTVDQVVIVFFLLSLLLVAFQLSMTAPIWQSIPLARYIQFPWRLGLFAILTNATLVAWIVQRKVRWQVWLLTGVLLIQVIIGLRATPTGYFSKLPIEFDLFEQSTTTSNENLPKDFTFHDYADWQPTAEIIEGEGEVSVRSWSGSKRSYTIVAATPVTVIEPTMYFPGWETTVFSGNSYRLAPYINSELIGGRIGYQLEAGAYQVNTEFTQHTAPRFAGNILSALMVAFVLGASGWIAYTKLKAVKSNHANT